jgi:PucR family transcriptional regulator, purine catabolism regulatory protein
MIGGVPLREVLGLESLAGARVVGGASGLDRRVRHVNVMEVPDILRWVNADELLLTTAYPLRDDPAALVALVPELAAKGLAGLALKPARYIDTIPSGVIEAADRLSFPLLELPPESSFNDIINSVLTIILNAQAVRLQRTAEIHERFTAIVLGGGGLRQIAEAVADALAAPVVILDGHGSVQASTAGAEAIGRLDSVIPQLGAPGDANEAGPMQLRVGDVSIAVKPIQVGPERFGAIVVLAEVNDLAEDQLDALEYASTVAALRQVQARAIAEADRRFQAVCLEELVTGHVDRAVLIDRAAAFKWDLSVPRAVVLAQLAELGGRPFSQLAGTAEETAVGHRLADVARQALGTRAIVWERGAEVAALVVPFAAGLAEMGERFVAEARRALPESTVSVGIGRPVDDPLRLADSYTEARRALSIGRWARGAGHVSLFAELGVDRLLVGVAKPELADFATQLIGPLLDYDARHRTELCRTLEIYLETRNGALAARRLFVHYNTLKNRLRLIEEILGPSLEDPDRSLGLALALRIERLPGV